MCCTEELTDMKPPRRRGSMLAVISDTEDTNRPALLAIISAATGAATASPTDGRCVTTSVITAASDTTQRNTGRAPLRSMSRPTSGVLTSVSKPPATKTTGNWASVTPALLT